MHQGGARGQRGQKRQWNGGRPPVDEEQSRRLGAREAVMRNDGSPAAMHSCVGRLVHEMDNQREAMVRPQPTG